MLSLPVKAKKKGKANAKENKSAKPDAASMTIK